MERCALVWIDSREAVIVRWREGRAAVERLASDVPAHHRATGHVRHDPSVRHGGGRSQTADETHRLEHLARFVDDVARRLPADTELIVLGPGTVRESLARHVQDIDVRHGRVRPVSDEASPRRTERQLIARLRHIAGADAARRVPGASRRCSTRIVRASGETMTIPPRMTAKRSSRPGRGPLERDEQDGG